MRLSSHVEIDGEVLEVTPEHDAKRKRLVNELNAEGFRVIAVAYRMFPGDNDEPHYTVQDESKMTLLGYLAFLDPPKETAPAALSKLHEHNVAVKILTGDNEIVTGTICKQVGLPVEHMLLGSDIEGMTEDQLEAAVGDYNGIRQALAGAQGAHHPCLAEQRSRGRIHGRRDQ